MPPTVSITIKQRAQPGVRRDYQETTKAHLVKRGNRHDAKDFSMYERNGKDQHIGNLKLVRKKVTPPEIHREV